MSKSLPQHVILADDEEFLRELLSEILEDFGLEVTAVENGQVALDTYKKDPHKYSLIITDINMPEMGGYDLIKALSQMEQKNSLPKLLLISGGQESNSNGLSPEQKKLISGSILKPFNTKSILSTLGNILASDQDTKAA